jgi:hypothetical protein
MMPTLPVCLTKELTAKVSTQVVINQGDDRDKVDLIFNCIDSYLEERGPFVSFATSFSSFGESMA